MKRIYLHGYSIKRLLAQWAYTVDLELAGWHNPPVV